MADKHEEIIQCSFCGRKELEVEQMISKRDSGVHICNRCVAEYRSTLRKESDTTK